MYYAARALIETTLVLYPCTFSQGMAAIGKQFGGQVAIVTGGADGLGKAIARMLAENGARVMLFDLAEDKMKIFVDELTSSGYDARSCKVDVSVEASVQEGFSEFAKFSDRLDIMVNCAGIVGPNGIKTESVAVEDFDRVYAGTIAKIVTVGVANLCHTEIF